MKSLVFLAVYMKQGYGVSVVIEALARELQSRGWRVTIGCSHADWDMTGLEIRTVSAEPAAVAALARSVGASVVVAHTTPYLEVLPHLAGEFSCWAWEHGEPNPAFFEHDRSERETITRRKQQTVYPALDGVVAISRFVRSEIDWPAARILYNGCDHVPDLGPKDPGQWRQRARPLRVGTLMRLGREEARYKGSALFRQLAAQVREHHTEIEFHVMGRGTPEDAESYQAIGCTVHLNASDAERARYLRDLDLLISPSLWEGCNLPMLEAQASGTAALAFDTGAHPEVAPLLTSGVPEMAALIAAYQADSELLEKHSEQCYRFVRNRFTWSRNAEILDGLLSAALQCRSVTSPRKAAGRWSAVVTFARFNAQRGLAYYRRQGLLRTLRRVGEEVASRAGWQKKPPSPEPLKAQEATYQRWLNAYDAPSGEDQATIGRHVAQLVPGCHFLIALDATTGDPALVAATVASVVAQAFPEWRLVIALPANDPPDLRTTLLRASRGDRRCELIPTTSPAPLIRTLAADEQGDLVLLLSARERLHPLALYLLAASYQERGAADLIYSDDDQIDHTGQRSQPHFKGAWDPELFFATDYLGPAVAFRRQTLHELIGPSSRVDDGRLTAPFFLVLQYLTRPTLTVHHLPFVLWHRQASVDAESTALALSEVRRQALEAFFADRGEPAEVLPAPGDTLRVRRPVPAPEPLVSLIIPTRDRVTLLRDCVEGLRHRTDYPSLEIMIVDNGSVEAETLSYFKELAHDSRVSVLPYPGRFNFSAINNYAARHARGSILGFINNDIVVREGDWLREMVSHALRPQVGAVGAKLLYANETIQHAGVAIGFLGVAGHTHHGYPAHHPGYHNRLRCIQTLSCVTAACLLSRRECFEQVGGLDERNLEVAFNDVDFCLKLGQAGYHILWTPWAELYHLESASRGSDVSFHNLPRFQREVAYMKSKWAAILPQDPFYSPNLALEGNTFDLAFPPRVKRPWRHHGSD